MQWATIQTGIHPSNVNVQLEGKVSSETIVNFLLKCNCYVHPSYIENSPNSVCEAQLIGVPIISTNVGGVSSLITHLWDGILVPSNDIYMLASYIIDISNNKKLAEKIGNNGYINSHDRHNPNKVVSDLLSTYNSIVSSHEKNS